MYLIEYQPPTALNRWRHKRRLRKMAEEVLPRSRWRHRRRIRHMAERVIPRSYEWVMLVVAALIWAVLAVLFVGWWTV